MTASPPLSRRRLLGLLSGWLWTRPGLATAALPSVLGIERPAGAVTAHTRWYRVHATIRLLSLPLFSKDDVGGACAMFEEAVSGSTRTTALQFSGGSWPDRLRGFNRFGMTQEAVRADGPVVEESAYLCFITTSNDKNNDKNFDQARKAFEDRSTSLPIAVAHGRAKRSGYVAALDRLTASASYTWRDCGRLIAEIRARISPPARALENANLDCVSRPFLHAVWSAMMNATPGGAQSQQSVFVHNARLYRLRSRVAAARDLHQLTGWIAEQDSERESEFCVWFDPRDASPLPVRIEFRPRSFLHLVFECDPAASGPTFPSLMAKEQS